MQLSASLNSSHHLSTQPFTEMERLNLWSFNLAQVRMGPLLFIMRPHHSNSNNAMQRLKDWIDRLLSYILYLKDIAENIYDNLCVILRPMDSHQNQISGYWEVAFYSKICVSTHKFNIETTSEWEYWFLEEIFSIPAPPLLTELYFVERLWPSRIASPTSRASSHLMACRVSDSSRSNRSATLVKRGWKRRWHVLFTLDS